MGRRNGTAAVEGGAKEAQFGGLQYVPSEMPFHPHAFQTCLPHPWQGRPPRARISPPGGWSSPVKRTCQQTTPPPLGEQSLGRRLEAQKSFTRGHFWSVPVSKIPTRQSHRF